MKLKAYKVEPENAESATASTANRIPSDLWERLRKTSVVYKVLGDLKSGKGIDAAIKRWSDSSVGSQIPGRSKDAAIAVEVLKEMKRRERGAEGAARQAGGAEVCGGAGAILCRAAKEGGV